MVWQAQLCLAIFRQSPPSVLAARLADPAAHMSSISEDGYGEEYSSPPRRQSGAFRHIAFLELGFCCFVEAGLASCLPVVLCALKCRASFLALLADARFLRACFGFEPGNLYICM